MRQELRNKIIIANREREELDLKLSKIGMYSVRDSIFRGKQGTPYTEYVCKIKDFIFN